MTPWLATLEDVKSALDAKQTARNNDQIARAIEAATPSIEGLTHRRFYPETATRYFDWPNFQYARSWRLWLDANELVSVSALVAGGVTISSNDYFLRRGDDRDEAPYSFVEIDLDSSSAFSSGNTHQRSIAITGVYMGCPLVELPAGSTAEALDDSETGVDVTDSTIGIGQIIRVDSERMIVTAKSMLDTGQNLGGSGLTAAVNDVTVPVTTGTSYAVGEVILIDSERMLIVDIASNNLTVKRAWDGSVLAIHATNADIYAPRTLTVVRGALGTAAAAHNTATAIVKHTPPAQIRTLAIAEAMATLLGELSGWASRIGSGDSARESGGGLAGLRDEVYTSFGRKARISAI